MTMLTTSLFFLIIFILKSLSEYNFDDNVYHPEYDQGDHSHSVP